MNNTFTARYEDQALVEFFKAPGNKPFKEEFERAAGGQVTTSREVVLVNNLTNIASVAQIETALKEMSDDLKTVSHAARQRAISMAKGGQ